MKTISVRPILLMCLCVPVLAGIQEIAPKDLTDSYIQGISIQHVNKKIPCAGKKSGVSECNVNENLVLTDTGQSASPNSAAATGTANLAATQAAVSVLNNGSATAAVDQAQRSLSTTGAALNQSGSQVNIQLFTPMPISTSANSTNVDISTNHGGAVLMFNVPQR